MQPRGGKAGRSEREALCAETNALGKFKDLVDELQTEMDNNEWEFEELKYNWLRRLSPVIRTQLYACLNASMLRRHPFFRKLSRAALRLLTRSCRTQRS